MRLFTWVVAQGEDQQEYTVDKNVETGDIVIRDVLNDVEMTMTEGFSICLARTLVNQYLKDQPYDQALRRPRTQANTN